MRLAVCVGFALLVAGCGGGGGSGESAPPPAAPAAPAAAPVPSATDLLTYLEDTNEGSFPGRKQDQTRGTVTFRTYPETGNTASIDGGAVFYQGPVAGGSAQPVQVARLADYACDKVPAACGKRRVHSLLVAGLTREFIVYTPYRAQAQGNPVVFALHGTSQSGDLFYRISRWREKADETGLIAVFPTALAHCYYEDENADGVDERNTNTKWAAGRLGDPVARPLCSAAEIASLPPADRARVDHPLADDIGFIRQAHAFVRANYPVDPKRVYVSGFSNGAEMSGRVVADAAELFAAGNSVSSTVSVTSVAVRPISVIHVVGELDPDQSKALGYPGGAIPLTEDLINNPAYRGGMLAPFLRVLQLGPAYTWSQTTFGSRSRVTSQFAFASSTVGASNTFRSVIIQGMGHEYPNGTNDPLRIVDPIWDFFKTQALP